MIKILVVFRIFIIPVYLHYNFFSSYTCTTPQYNGIRRRGSLPFDALWCF